MSWSTNEIDEVPNEKIALRRLGHELQAHDTGHDEDEAEEAKRVPRFPEEDDTENRRAQASDAGPDRVARPDGKRSEGLRQKEEA